MFPVSDVIPSRRTPIVTLALITLNLLVFLYLTQLDAAERYALVRRFGVRSATFPGPAAISSSFLHAGWVQLGTNMLWLWLFGGTLENAIGRVQFLALYLASSAIAALAHANTPSSSFAPMIGAGGAVAGVLGAYLVLYPRSRVLTAVFAITHVDVIELPAVFFLALWFLLQLFSGGASLVRAAEGPIMLWPHIVALVAGAIAGAYARFASRALRRYWKKDEGRRKKEEGEG